MKTQKKRFVFKMDQIDESGIFSGYASTFGNVDFSGDVVVKGAFKKTIKETKGKIPILDHHEPSRQIGWNLEAREDDRGLFVRGQLDLNVNLARERHSIMRTALEIGARAGLSIGFRTIKEETDKKDPNVRLLKEVQLFEYSVVTFPMNASAEVTDVKARQELLENFLSNELDLNELQVENIITVLGKIKVKEGLEKMDIENLEQPLKNLLSSVKGGCCGCETKGRALSALLNRRITALEDDKNPRSEIISRMGSAGGISSNTVNEILSGNINCPPKRRLEGFARALNVNASTLISAAEKDGCKYD